MNIGEDRKNGEEAKMSDYQNKMEDLSNGEEIPIKEGQIIEDHQKIGKKNFSSARGKIFRYRPKNRYPK